jgi:16S rRNA (guanine966-N2)-methyltransferase
MRIVTGKFKGKEILSPPTGIELRPTSDKVREALFDRIRPFLKDAYFLDLYSGSGAVGIEALSEGAKFVAFVEKSPFSLRTLKKNLALFNLKKYVTIIKKDVLLLLKNPQKILDRVDRPFDFVFLDPPFPEKIAGQTVSLLSNFPLLREGTWVIAEHWKVEVLKDTYQGRFLLKKIKERRYGKVVLTYYEVQPNGKGNSESSSNINSSG